MELIQLFVGPLVLVYDQPSFIRRQKVFLPEVVFHAFQYLWRRTGMVPFQAV